MKEEKTYNIIQNNYVWIGNNSSNWLMWVISSQLYLLWALLVFESEMNM